MTDLMYRACLGKALALAELRTAYEMIVLRYELKLCEVGPVSGTRGL